jgi:hypothetical protein
MTSHQVEIEQLNDTANTAMNNLGLPPRLQRKIKDYLLIT